MDDLKKFSQAMLNGINANQGGAGVKGVSSEVNQAFGSQMRSPLVAASSGIGGAASTIAANEEEAARAARSARISELQDMIDPSKYRRERRDDGGYSFFDPSGKEIDIDTFARRTGVRRTEALEGSENPLDLQYMNDYNNMEKLMKSAFDGDNATVQSILSENGLDANTKPEDYASKLMEKYPHMYGMGSYWKSRSNLGRPVFKMPNTSSNYGIDINSILQSELGR